MPFSKKGFLAKLRRLPESGKAEPSPTPCPSEIETATSSSAAERPIPAIQADDAGAAIDDFQKQIGTTDYGSVGSTSPDSTTVISGRSGRGSLDPLSPSPTLSVGKSSVSFCPELPASVGDTMKDVEADPKVRFSKDHLSTVGPDNDDDDAEYFESIDALMQGKESSGRRRSIRRSPKRVSSPLGSDSDRRRSSTLTSTSCEETQISIEDEEMTEEQIFESIRLHKELVEQVNKQPWKMKKRLKVVRKAKVYIKKHEGVLEERLAHSKNTKDIMTRYTLIFERYWERLKREGMNLAKNLIPWEMRIKRIESHFGSVVASYFTFLRWVFWMNIVMCVFISCFVIVPEVLGADRQTAGDRKELMPDEDAKAFNLQQLWDFEGFLKYSPIFYGYYTNKDKTRQGYRIPFAYFMTLLGMYGYSFAAILRRMAENTRLSKLSDKDEDCAFTWKLYTGWDYMIGNAETADNKVASLLMSFKENILEEREKTKEERNWKIVSLRALANFLVFILLVSSAYAVVLVVRRSQEPEADDSWWRQNEVTVTVSMISTAYPNLFDIIGTIEHNHPRIQLRWQLGRIMILYLLNLYTLIFALFSKVDVMSAELIVLRPNTTVAPLAPSTTPFSVLSFPEYGWDSHGANNVSNRSALPVPDHVINYILASRNLSSYYCRISSANASCVTFACRCNTKYLKKPQSSTLTPTAATSTYPTYDNLDSDDGAYMDATESSSFSNYSGGTWPPPMDVNRTASRNLSRVYYDAMSRSNATRTDGWVTKRKKNRYKSDRNGHISFGDDSDLALTDPSLVNDTGPLLIGDGPYFSTPYPLYDIEDIDDDIRALAESSCVVTVCIDSVDFEALTTASPFYADYDDNNNTNRPPFVAFNMSPSYTREYNFASKEYSATHTATVDSGGRNVTDDEDEVNVDGLSVKTRKTLRKLCWETMFGQELVKLTVMDLVMTVANILLTDFFRALFVRIMNHCWFWDLEKQFPGYGDFKIAENILHLVNNQGMIWMGMFFSPGIPGVNMIKLVIILYIRSWAVLTCNIPHETVFKASRSNNFYYALLLTMLFLCTLPVGYAVVWLRPSWHCGPFSQYDKIYHIFTSSLESVLPNVAIRALDYIASPGIVIPLLLLLILYIYYKSSEVNSLREANKELKIQLRRERTEERRKVFQMADARHDPPKLSSKWAGMKSFLPVVPSKVKILPKQNTEQLRQQAGPSVRLQKEDDSTNLGSSAFANAIGSVLKANNMKISGLNKSILGAAKSMKEANEETSKGELPIRSVLTREVASSKKNNLSLNNSDTLKKEKSTKPDVDAKENPRLD